MVSYEKVRVKNKKPLDCASIRQRRKEVGCFLKEYPDGLIEDVSKIFKK